MSADARLRTPHRRAVTWHWSSRDEHRALLAVLGGVVAFGLALRWLPPQLDLMHTFEHRLGFMAPTCGLTRAGIALFRGDLARAWTYNPAIFLVAVGAAVLVLRFLAGAASGRWLTIDARVGRSHRVVLVILLAALWANQQAHFGLLAA